MMILLSNAIQQGQDLVRKFGMRGSMALADQAAVGAAGFVASIIVGRYCGPAEFGLFALGMTLVILLVGVLESLITSPYIVFISRLKSHERAAYAGSVLLQYGLLLTLVTVILAVAAGVTAYWHLGPAGLPAVLATLAALAPFRLLRELARRLAYAELNVRSALGVGLSVLTLQVGSVVILAYSGQLSAVTALAAISIGSGLAGGGWLLLHRREFHLWGGSFRWAMVRSYQLGRWFFASQMLNILASHTIPWLVAIALDKERAGIYAACAAIVALANPLVTTASNVLTPLLSHAYADDGVAGVRRLVHRAALLLGGLAISLCLFMFIAGNWTLGLFFGDEFTGYGMLIAMLALGESLMIATMPAGRSLIVFERANLCFIASSFGLAATLSVSLLAMPYWGVSGAAAGRLAGAALCSGIMVASYPLVARYLCGHAPPSAEIGVVQIEARTETPVSTKSSASSPAYASSSSLAENTT